MTLTVTRKADREKMAEFFLGHWISCPGFTAIRHNPAPVWPGKRNIALELTGPRGACVTIHFNPDNWQRDKNTYVLSWHISTDSSARFAWNFASSRNEHHKQKATDVAIGFDALKELFFDRMTKLQRGEAFE